MVPQAILDKIREQLTSPIVAWEAELLKDVKDGKTLAPHIDKIESQIDRLFNVVKKERINISGLL